MFCSGSDSCTYDKGVLQLEVQCTCFRQCPGGKCCPRGASEQRRLVHKLVGHACRLTAQRITECCIRLGRLQQYLDRNACASTVVDSDLDNSTRVAIVIILLCGNPVVRFDL